MVVVAVMVDGGSGVCNGGDGGSGGCNGGDGGSGTGGFKAVIPFVQSIFFDQAAQKDFPLPEFEVPQLYLRISNGFVCCDLTQ